MDNHSAHDEFEIVIVHGINKELRVTETETIEAVKLAALDCFGISAADAGQYVLRAKHDSQKDNQLSENETVAEAKLHPEQHITLAAGTPYGAW